MSSDYDDVRNGNLEVSYINGIRDFIRRIGEDPEREGLIDTPYRVVKSMFEFLSGYNYTPEDIQKVMKTFSDAHSDEMVVVSQIDFVSMCEHHMLPFIGKAHVGYLPNGCVVGLSKIPRLVEIFSRRLQVQERLTEEIANTLQTTLSPKGCGVVLEAQHLCCSCRGVKKANVMMTTSALRGCFKEGAVRSEFLSFIRGVK